MKSYLKKNILNFLSRRGFERKSNVKDRKDELYEHMKHVFYPENSKFISIIFSKDRAMQLDAFLGSYFENVANYSGIKVLYHTSSAEHENSYADLRKIYADRPVEFIKESNFRSQLLEILADSDAGKVFFYVDDMLFTQKVNYDWFKHIDPLKNIVSLSRGIDLTYSTVLAKELKVPAFGTYDPHLSFFSWNEIKEYSDWSYPLGVSGYMYSRTEILALLTVCDFKAPNSLEGAMQGFLSYFITRLGISLEKVAAPCIHSNLTQTEGYNHVLGHFSVEELLQLWKNNKRIDYHEFMGLPVTEAEVRKYTFVERNE